MRASRAEIEELRRAAAEGPDNADLSALTTRPMLLGYVITVSRSEGRDELHDVELLCRAGEYTRDDLRECESVLRPLGYIQVADLLRKLSRRKRCD